MRWQYGIEYVTVAKKELHKGFQWLPVEEITQVLNAWGEKEWELVTTIPSSTWHTADIGEEALLTIQMIFRKPNP